MKTIHVAICDDDLIAINAITGAVKYIFLQSEIAVKISEFSDAKKLLKELGNTNFDLLFLDIDMPFISGIDIGARIRSGEAKGSTNSEIIYVSSCEDRVFDSFAVTPLGFVRKNHFLKDLQKYVDIFIKKINKNEKETITIKSRGQLHLLVIDEINYIESSLRSKIIYMSDCDIHYTITSTIKEIEDIFKPYGFIRTHSGFLVNYNKISNIKSDQVILKSGKSIPISRRNVPAVREKYLELMREKGDVLF